MKACVFDIKINKFDKSITTARLLCRNNVIKKFLRTVFSFTTIDVVYINEGKIQLSLRIVVIRSVKKGEKGGGDLWWFD